MSREIKFRQFINEKMSYSGFEMCGSFVNPNVNIDIYPLMQYTGLKDKNGVEIYEGDILSYYLGSDYHIGEVKYDTDRFAIDWFRCSNILNRSCKNIYKRSKVIGNIHENKDLL